ncbi:hypothetical protein LMH87_006226 [Akanthomyces muscarius]|uniref:Uncharacterized protein n=1 Tax=Akanthomyces muscarius TaxID=2231603 RepID=A0A9W8QPW8_AKAMU|nr:hypothetical protein LMH87_006226 [Akanthomyces muscarius]KAJ4164556.1 hypothetical protein LMH87_006226 [Akanthomyces muscarius]
MPFVRKHRGSTASYPDIIQTPVLRKLIVWVANVPVCVPKQRGASKNQKLATSHTTHIDTIVCDWRPRLTLFGETFLVTNVC